MNRGYHPGTSTNLNRKQMMTVRGGYKLAVKGDVAYNMMRMWHGAVGVVPDRWLS